MPTYPPLTIDLGGAFAPKQEPPSAPAAPASPAPASPASPAPAAPTTSTSGLQPPRDRAESEAWLRDQIKLMQAELDGAKQEAAERQRELESARSDAAAARLGQRSSTPSRAAESVGQASARRMRAINSVGGNARYHSLSVDQRFEVLGMPAPTPEERAEVGQYFGRGSNAAQAQGLMSRSPQKYARLRHLAIESGLI